MSTTYYAAPGSLIVCVETGMPERAVRIGIGRTVADARADLSDTPIQSAGRDPATDGLAWARNQGWLDTDDLTRIEVGDDDDALTSSAWLEDPMPARKPKPKLPARGGARPGAGRPRTRPEGARKVQVVLSPAAAEAWAAHEGDRSRWVSQLIEKDTR